MDRILPPVRSTSELAPGHEERATPFSQPTLVLTQPAYSQLTWEAPSWRRQHERLVEREAALKAAGEALQAPLRDLRQRLSGAKSEKAAGCAAAGPSKPGRPRHRGQQPGHPGHGRRDRSALPVVAAVPDGSEAAPHCPTCGAAFTPCPGVEESPLIAVQGRADRRRIQRPRSQKPCAGPQVAGIVTAPPAPRVLPTSPLGVSVWPQVWLDKDLSGRPTERVGEAWRHHGLPRSQGPRSDGWRKRAGRFGPVLSKREERQMSAKLFDGEEPRWEVVEEVAGKTGPRWSLGLMPSASVVFDRLAPGRGAAVPKAHGAQCHQALVAVVWGCARSRADQCLARERDELLLALCWAQVRRAVRKAARSGPECERGRFGWVDARREFYRLHAARLEAWESTGRLEQHPAAGVERHRDLETQRRPRRARCEAPRQEPALALVKPKVLSRRHNHGDGRTGLVGRPEVALDKNSAERRLRHPVVGRKNSYGAGRVWSAHLAARRCSVLQPVVLWGRTPYHWRSALRQAGVEHGGQSPTALSALLPWPMTPERRAELARPVLVTAPPVALQALDRGEPDAVDTSSGGIGLVA
jgi:transposase